MNLSRLTLIAFSLLAVGLVATVVYRIATAGEIPGERFRRPDPSVAATATGWADEASCIDCHEQAESFHKTGHARTLTPAAAESSWSNLNRLQDSAIGQAESVRYSKIGESIFATRTNEDGQTTSVPVEWCFGSGTHAQTWATVLQDGLGQTDLLELRWTWYHHKDDFGITPGQPESCGMGHLASFGLQFDGARAWRCFRCHATQLSGHAGHLDLDNMHAGVQCQSCHGPRKAHVESDGEFHDAVWAFQDRDDQVKRCAECHRDPGEQPSEAIVPGNPDIARFQPIGLSQSRCYLESDMSCTTCHDVHRPMSDQQPRRISQCTQCHDSANTHHTTCAAGMNDGCIDCHMPALDTGRGLEFTDHWIRIPEEGDDSR